VVALGVELPGEEAREAGEAGQQGGEEDGGGPGRGLGRVLEGEDDEDRGCNSVGEGWVVRWALKRENWKRLTRARRR